MKIVMRYSKGDFTVLWKPKVCIHSAICFRSLPGVFNPKNTPWITINAEPIEKIKEVIDRCPSGALSYEINQSDSAESESNNDKLLKNGVVMSEVKIIENGPLLVSGEFDLVNSEGEKITKPERCALCRCGASENKPFCDGTHRKIEWKE